MAGAQAHSAQPNANHDVQRRIAPSPHENADDVARSRGTVKSMFPFDAERQGPLVALARKAASRLRSLLISSVATLGGVACQAELQPESPVLPRSAPQEAPSPPVWARFEEAQGWPVVSEVSPSEHLGTARTATIRIWPAAEATYRDLVPHTILPDGTAVLEALSRRAGDEPSRYFAMERTAEGWTYWALDAKGRGNPDTSGLCQRCHAEAVADELFGPRRSGATPLTSAAPGAAAVDAQPSP